LLCTTNTTIDILRGLVGQELCTYHWYPIDENSCKCVLTC
jgi:hypothetical protein